MRLRSESRQYAERALTSHRRGARACRAPCLRLIDCALGERALIDRHVFVRDAIDRKPSRLRFARAASTARARACPSGASAASSRAAPDRRADEHARRAAVEHLGNAADARADDRAARLARLAQHERTRVLDARASAKTSASARYGRGSATKPVKCTDVRDAQLRGELLHRLAFGTVADQVQMRLREEFALELALCACTRANACSRSAMPLRRNMPATLSTFGCFSRTGLAGGRQMRRGAPTAPLRTTESRSGTMPRSIKRPPRPRRSQRPCGRPQRTSDALFWNS